MTGPSPRMRVVVAMPHYWYRDESDHRGARTEAAERRAEALQRTLLSLRAHAGTDGFIMMMDGRTPVGLPAAYDLDIYVLTTGDRHVLPLCTAPTSWYRHVPTSEDPHWLPYATQDALAQAGDADYYVYVDDDQRFEDPDWLAKVAAFTRVAGDDAVLLPQQYEQQAGYPLRLYLAGDLLPRVRPPMRRGGAKVVVPWGGARVECVQPDNPHAAFYALSAAQFHRMRRRPEFGRRDASFMGPGESAATLCLMKTFLIYKPRWEQAAWFAIRHDGEKYIRLLGG